MASPTPFINAGSIFGRLTTTGVIERRGKYLYQEVRCSCGVVKFVEQTNLKKGASKSCGCLSAELTSSRSTTHGKRSEPIYAVWNALKQRTTNPNSASWSAYGGRGITICDNWLTFEGFYADMGDPPFAGASVERKNNSLGYSKENCVWATSEEQNNNKRNNRYFEYRGKAYNLLELCELSKLPLTTLRNRLYTYKWSVVKAVETPIFAKKDHEIS